MEGTWLHILFLAFLLAVTHAATENATNNVKDPKVISVFQVVKFQNSMCTGGNDRNGTCYTSAECDDVGGTASGACADGFGVCCIMTLTTGGTSALNNTYISPTVFTPPSQTYTLCPCSDNICRIKLDFNTFTLSGPNTGLGALVENGTPPAAAADIQVGESMGDCTIDTFQVISPSGRSSPVICGVNGNQHMILDMADDDCAEVVLGLGATTSTTRELSITVTQYACGDHDSAGPPGCLQYFPNESGKIRSFNFRDITPGASVLYNDVHLSAQNYEICIRRGNNMKYICYVPCTTTIGTTEAAGEQLDTLNSFGLSKNGENAASSASQGSLCATDYIYIPLGTYLVGEMAIATENYQVNEIAATTTHRLCGNALNSDIEAGASVSMCSYSVPFNVGVNFDQDEFCTVNTDGDTCEFLGTIAAAGGAGSVGFSLCYVQA